MRIHYSQTQLPHNFSECRYLLKALDMYWHEDCLKCGCCDCRLGEVGSTLYTKANLILCKRDYLRYVLNKQSVCFARPLSRQILLGKILADIYDGITRLAPTSQ